MAKESRGFTQSSCWGNSRVLPAAKNGMRGSRFSNKPTESVNEATVETGRPTTDSNFELLFLCAGAVLLACVLFAQVFSWIIAAPLFLLLLGTELHQPLNINRVALTLVCLVFAAPSAYYFEFSDVGRAAISGPFGTNLDIYSSGYFLLSTSEIAVGIVMTSFQVIPQIIFLAVMSKYYEGVTTRRAAILVGITGQIPFGMLVVWSYVVFPPPALWVILPLPLALIIGLVILWQFPAGHSPTT
jgi:hypothetical protein